MATGCLLILESYSVCLYLYNCNGLCAYLYNEKVDFPLFYLVNIFVFTFIVFIISYSFIMLFSVFYSCLSTCITWFHLSLWFLVLCLLLCTNIIRQTPDSDFSLTSSVPLSVSYTRSLSLSCLTCHSSFYRNATVLFPVFSFNGCDTVTLPVTYSTAEWRRALLWLLGYRGTRSISEEFLYYELSHCAAFTYGAFEEISFLFYILIYSYKNLLCYML